MDAEALPLVYGPAERAEIERLTDAAEVALTRDNWKRHRALLRDVEVIFSGWSAPLMDEDFLAAAPRLKAVFYAAGSTRYFTTEAFWQRGIVLSSANAANAVPVAEYTVGVALLSLKHFWRWSAHARRGEPWGDHTRPIPGAYRSTIGLVSFGAIARKVAELLESHDVTTLVYCPFMTEAQARAHGVRRASLQEVFSKSDVVSVHAPVLPDTIGMIGRDLVARMKPGATLINTARGVVLNQPEVLAVLRERTDLTAILDVTEPEPPAPGSEVLSLPNVVITPHIAGSHGAECRRMGRYMIDEAGRFLAGEPLRWQVTRDMATRGA